MRSGRRKAVIFVSICIIVLLSVSLNGIVVRIKVLSDYKKLTSSKENRERLSYVLPVKKWNSSDDRKNAINVGYALFDFPFGSIQEIKKEGSLVSIAGDSRIKGVRNLFFANHLDFSIVNYQRTCLEGIKGVRNLFFANQEVLRFKKRFFAKSGNVDNEKPTNQSILLNLAIGKYLPGHFVPFL